MKLGTGLIEIDLDTGLFDSLQGSRPSNQGKAEEILDGRNLAIVLATVRDAMGQTRKGMLVRLLDANGKLLDQTQTDERGIVLLRYPQSIKNNQISGLPGKLEIVGYDDGKSRTMDFSIPQNAQHSLVDFKIPELPKNLAGSGDDLLQRLPSDFSPALFDDLVRLYGADPLLGGRENSNQFASRRAPILRQTTLPRLEQRPADSKDTTPLRRYLVTFRQQWIFLGYSLGELAKLNALPPGQIVDESRRVLERSVENVQNLTEEAVTTARQTLESTVMTLSNALSNVRSTLTTQANATTNTTAQAKAYAFGGGIPGLFGGGEAGASASLRNELTSSLHSNLNIGSIQSATAQANETVRQLQSTVNQAVRTASNTLRDLQTSALSSLHQVAPLLSRVVNLLNWTIYENYAVRTEVADVIEVVAASALQQDNNPTPFTAEDIIEYEPFFRPFLLKGDLARRFDSLKQMVEEERLAALPVEAIGFQVNFTAQFNSADLIIKIDNQETRVRLRRSATQASGYLRLNTPLDILSGNVNVQISLMAQTDYEVQRVFTPRSLPGLPASFSGYSYETRYANADANGQPRFTIQVASIEFQYAGVSGSLRNHSEYFGSTLQVDESTRQVGPQTFPLRMARLELHEDQDPLVLHINRNKSYYLGLLLQSALDLPSLRKDAPQLKGLDANLWKLPILGVEGDQLLFLRNVQNNDTYGENLLNELGAATIIQIAAPGTYSEALQGILELTDLVGKIPPSLERTLNIVPAGYQILDLKLPVGGKESGGLPGNLPGNLPGSGG